jgi:hypothetical protein
MVRLFVDVFSIFTHALTPLENSTFLQLVLFAEAIEKIPPKIQILARTNNFFFIRVW